MRTLRERDFTTYPRQFKAYRWFKPLLTGLLFVLFFFLSASFVHLITSLAFHTTVSSSGYDDLDFYSAAGAFFNGAMGAISIPSLLLAVLIVKDRPLSSYFSSMGGWRWNPFLKTFAACFVVFGIPTIIKFLLSGKTGDVQFTAGGFIFLILFMPLTCIAEELIFRGYKLVQAAGYRPNRSGNCVCCGPSIQPHRRCLYSRKCLYLWDHLHLFPGD